VALLKKKDGKKKPKKKKVKKAKKAKAPGVAVEKPGMNVYTIMLMISLAAISVACLLLWMELGTYGDYPWWKTR